MSALPATPPWPLKLSIRRNARVLSIAFDDGANFDISFELLRVESPSAEVQGHSAAQKQMVRGKSDVLITRAEPVGRYAVRLVFDDGHSGLVEFLGHLERRVGVEKVVIGHRLAVQDRAARDRRLI
ncbi:MAG: DUF971 domain-containing protein [Sphingopyxis sp.]|nr:DUF971 domain-containing protein [Sphingopyxis sp.]